MDVLSYICLAIILVTSVLAIMSRKLIRASIYLAITSAALAVLMYCFGAVWAAVLELSVCSGLVTVIFITTISIAKHIPNDVQDNKRMAHLPLVLIIVGIVLIILAMTLPFDLTHEALPQVDQFKVVLWNSRQPDIWGQMIVLLTGAISIVVFFKERD